MKVKVWKCESVKVRAWKRESDWDEGGFDKGDSDWTEWHGLQCESESVKVIMWKWEHESVKGDCDWTEWRGLQWMHFCWTIYFEDKDETWYKRD